MFDLWCNHIRILIVIICCTERMFYLFKYLLFFIAWWFFYLHFAFWFAYFCVCLYSIYKVFYCVSIDWSYMCTIFLSLILLGFDICDIFFCVINLSTLIIKYSYELFACSIYFKQCNSFFSDSQVLK